ncbi:MAG: DUF6265 family protein [Erythrobacter sp.]
MASLEVWLALNEAEFGLEESMRTFSGIVGRVSPTLRLLAAGMLALVHPVLAQAQEPQSALESDQAPNLERIETRIGQEGFESPPAQLAQLDWLIGQWAGYGIGGARSMESWLAPIGGTMVGTFVQETAEGSIMFTEHMYLMQEGETLVLRLKHFNADLTGWEEKDDMLTFRLVAIEDCAVYFNALTLRCADSENPGAGLVAAVRMQSGDELLFQFSSIISPQAGLCVEEMTTLDMNFCAANILTQAEARRTQYLASAIDRNDTLPDLVAQITASDEAFIAYRDAECGAVWESWKDGTIRTIMALSCRIEMTDQRTHQIWQTWLTHQDSAPPILPEPKPSR